MSKKTQIIYFLIAMVIIYAVDVEYGIKGMVWILAITNVALLMNLEIASEQTRNLKK